MEFDSPLIEGVLIKRYKRFLADIRLADDTVVTAHTPNTGAMTGCAIPGSRVWCRDTRSPTRKYPLSWELVETAPGEITGINTGLSNDLVAECLASGAVAECLPGFNLRREVRYGEENSRIDILLEYPDWPDCYIEVKNVTLVEEGIARFPDAVSKRGTKHLRELASMVEQGHRGIIFYCVQRSDVHEVQPADEIDAEYGQVLREVLAQGVEALAWRAEVSPQRVQLVEPVTVRCP